jgi:hypothetical protein
VKCSENSYTIWQSLVASKFPNPRRTVKEDLSPTAEGRVVTTSYRIKGKSNVCSSLKKTVICIVI